MLLSRNFWIKFYIVVTFLKSLIIITIFCTLVMYWCFSKHFPCTNSHLQRLKWVSNLEVGIVCSEDRGVKSYSVDKNILMSFSSKAPKDSPAMVRLYLLDLLVILGTEVLTNYHMTSEVSDNPVTEWCRKRREFQYYSSFCLYLSNNSSDFSFWKTPL